MDQPVSAAWEHGSFGAILREYRREACLSQEQLAERAELSERTVRNLEADRVQSPRADTVRLLADALELSHADRRRWIDAARSVNHQAEPAISGADGRVSPTNDAHTALSPAARDLGSVPKRSDGSRTGKFQAKIHALRPRGDKSTGQVAKDVEMTEAVPHSSADQWDTGTHCDRGLPGADRQELAELRRENRRLRKDIEILKRATAIFAAATR